MESESEHDRKQAIAAVAASTRRERVLGHLVNNGPTTPSEAMREIETLARPKISEMLTDLQNVGCVELLVPEDTQKGRLYGATELGEDVFGVVGDE